MNNFIALLGIGKWGINLKRILVFLNTLKYLNDIKKTKFNELNIPYKCISTILKNKSITAIAIATPINIHFNLAKKALENKKHIFVEKPLVKNFSQIKVLNKLSRKYNKLIMVGHLLQYHHAFIKTKRIINSNYLGKIKNIYFIRTSILNFKNLYDVFWDYTPHDISMLLSIIKKKPKKIKVISVILKNTLLIKVLFLVKFINNLFVKIYVSKNEDKKWQLLKIIGEKKILKFNDVNSWENKIKLHYKNKVKINIKLLKKEPLLNECQCFIKSMKKKKSLTDCNESKNVVGFMEKIVFILLKFKKNR